VATAKAISGGELEASSGEMTHVTLNHVLRPNARLQSHWALSLSIRVKGPPKESISSLVFFLARVRTARVQIITENKLPTSPGSTSTSR
jgi:hypothetical protein